MVRLAIIAGPVALAFTIWCAFDARASRVGVRRLPRWAWILVILLLPPLGGILWLTLGRPPKVVGYQPPSESTPWSQRPTRESGEDFQRRVRERAEVQRLQAEERQRKSREAAAAEKPDEITEDDPRSDAGGPGGGAGGQ
ncbi:PLDc N-terminal domain-containing protein [Nocardioidaceae bacterium]|nr:PLDc N-terminal domain-containing protein [Nocardioidaceae bacterium]